MNGNAVVELFTHDGYFGPTAALCGGRGSSSRGGGGKGAKKGGGDITSAAVVESRLAQGFGERGREHRLGGGGKAQVRGTVLDRCLEFQIFRGQVVI